MAVPAHRFWAARVVAVPGAWTRRKRRSSTTGTLRRSSTPPSSTGTAASSGCAPGTAASSPSERDHAGVTGVSGASFPLGVGGPRRRVTPSARGFTRHQHITYRRDGTLLLLGGWPAHRHFAAPSALLAVVMGSRTRCGPSDLSSAARGSLSSQPGRFGPRIAAALDEDDLLAITGNSGTGPRTSSWTHHPGHLRRALLEDMCKLPNNVPDTSS